MWVTFSESLANSAGAGDGSVFVSIENVAMINKQLCRCMRSFVRQCGQGYFGKITGAKGVDGLSDKCCVNVF